MASLPRWVEYGAFMLAFLAGCINAIGLLGFQHQSISHLSGTATLLVTDLLRFNQTSWDLFFVLISFLIGSMISGFLLSGSSLKLGRHYDSLLFIEAALLIAAVYYLSNETSIGHYLASTACGLQNALATRYSGAVIRTTHLTGIFTDLGIMLGAALRKETFDNRKGILFLLIIIGFILGGTLGAYLFKSIAFKALLLPAFSCIVLGFCYRVYWQYSLKQEKPSHEKEPS